MASGNTTGRAVCPVCTEPIAFPVNAAYLSKTEVAVSVDLAPVNEHLASHQASLTTELPAPAVSFAPPVQCWHTESGSPCDWNVCRQPDRLASGDVGTDPAGQQ
jgi:hypothetical protein